MGPKASRPGITARLVLPAVSVGPEHPGCSVLGDVRAVRRSGVVGPRLGRRPNRPVRSRKGLSTATGLVASESVFLYRKPLAFPSSWTLAPCAAPWSGEGGAAWFRLDQRPAPFQPKVYTSGKPRKFIIMVYTWYIPDI